MKPIQTTGLPARFSRAMVALHWLMLALLIAVYLCMELSGNFPRGSDTRGLLRSWHYLLGLSVFVLVWVRLAVKLTTPAPLITPPPPRWQDRASKALQWGFYGFMVLMPLAGWLTLSAGGKPIMLFGFHLFSLVAENKALASQVKQLHELGATVGYFMLAVHATAALYHHYFLRDNTLQRMLPGQH